VSPRATPFAFTLATALAWTLVLGVVIDRAELFVAAIPLACALLAARAPAPAPRFTLRPRLSADRLAEGDRLVVTVTIAAADALPMIELVVALPPLVELDSGSNRVVLGVAAGAEEDWSFAVRCPARGRFDLGTLYVRLWDRRGMAVWESVEAHKLPLSVYPYVAPVRHLPLPQRTQLAFGNYISPRLGEGIEPGEIRPFLPGDRTRRINWRASLRRQALHVTEFHEEHNADIVLLLDALSDTGAPPYSTLDLSVRAAAALAQAHLAAKDRVGFVEFGGFLRWINPASGRRQGEVLAEGLLPAATHFSYVVPQLERLPARILPPQALVVALSPLLDQRFVRALIDLWARGFDLALIAISPVEPTSWVLKGSPLDRAACRLWALEWQARLDRLHGIGMAIVEWHPDAPLEAALAALPRSRPRAAVWR
jgi:uncharacterized protein (DUF58 family)